MGECADARNMSAHALAGPAFAAAFPAARIVPANIKHKRGCRIKRKVLKTIAPQKKSEKIRLRPDFFHKKTSQTSKSLAHLVKYKYATTKYFTG